VWRPSRGRRSSPNYFTVDMGACSRCTLERLGKQFTPDFVRTGLRSAHDDLSEVSVLLHERGHEFVKKSEYIGAGQHLGLAPGPAPMPVAGFYSREVTSLATLLSPLTKQFQEGTKIVKHARIRVPRFSAL
jgi:hypothetical protein